jgi:hypothetical protein
LGNNQEAQNASAEFGTLLKAGCLMNPDLYGFGIDATIPACRTLIWDQFLKPRYYDQGVSAYWLDETDGEGSNKPGDGPWNGYLPPLLERWVTFDRLAEIYLHLSICIHQVCLNYPD